MTEIDSEELEPKQSYRLLITGSRKWTDVELIKKVLLTAWVKNPDGVLISGNCPKGADKMCENIWPGEIERYPAKWKRPDGTKNNAAGFERNVEMVNSKPDLCFAFIKDKSPGATMTANLCEKEGIPVFYFRE